MVAALAERARRTPREPWLFYREGWDWRWRSWARVADQVMRGLTALREKLTMLQDQSSEAGPIAANYRIGFDASLDPDAITSGLVVQAAGVIAVPVDLDSTGLAWATTLGCSAWVEVEGTRFVERSDRDPERLVLPAALSATDPTPRQPLVLDLEPAGGEIEMQPRVTAAASELMVAARRLEGRLPPSARKGSLFKAGAPEQAIFCCAPGLGADVARLLQTWTLVRGAAWVLEPDLEAFVETVLWARPTLVCAAAAELTELASRLQRRKHRRHSRLEAILVADGELETVGVWREQGVRVITLAD